jgi:hypothetical protein
VERGVVEITFLLNDLQDRWLERVRNEHMAIWLYDSYHEDSADAGTKKEMEVIQDHLLPALCHAISSTVFPRRDW